MSIDCDKAPPLFYVLPVIYRLDQPFEGTIYLYAEPEIIYDEKQFEKYANNFDFCKDIYLAAFSHFTHIVTGY